MTNVNFRVQVLHVRTETGRHSSEGERSPNSSGQHRFLLASFSPFFFSDLMSHIRVEITEDSVYLGLKISALKTWLRSESNTEQCLIRLL